MACIWLRGLVMYPPGASTTSLSSDLKPFSAGVGAAQLEHCAEARDADLLSASRRHDGHGCCF